MRPWHCAVFRAEPRVRMVVANQAATQLCFCRAGRPDVREHWRMPVYSSTSILMRGQMAAQSSGPRRVLRLINLDNNGLLQFEIGENLSILSLF